MGMGLDNEPIIEQCDNVPVRKYYEQLKINAQLKARNEELEKDKLELALKSVSAVRNLTTEEFQKALDKAGGKVVEIKVLEEMQEVYNKLLAENAQLKAKAQEVSKYQIIKEFVENVERRAENKMLMTNKLEGAHYAAMKEILAEIKAADGIIDATVKLKLKKVNK